MAYLLYLSSVARRNVFYVASARTTCTLQSHMRMMQLVFNFMGRLPLAALRLESTRFMHMLCTLVHRSRK